MAFFPNDTTENQLLSCPEPDLATFANEQCADFATDWAPFTVESEVTRGKQLRQCKPSAPHHNEIKICVDYARPCTEKKQSYRSCCPKACYEISSPPCPPSPMCGCCPQTSTYRSKSCKRSKTSLPHHKQCPLRIMELAAPTKRHCLDTWRSKSHILPDFMIERVRQYVLDEKPVIEIPEAINCFKRRVSNRSSRNCRPRMNDACMADMRKFSAIFAYCVAQKLDKPLNITLNPELEKISKIVSYELSSVTKKRKKSDKSKKNKFDKQMQDEISKKVTAWIDNVLVDSSDKLLEEDLKELEETEGPVSDILDDLIDKVVDSCEPPEDYTSGNVTGNESGADLMSQKSNTDSLKISSNIDLKDGEAEREEAANEISIENSTNELNQTGLDVAQEFIDVTIDKLNIPSDGLEAVPDGLDSDNDDLTGETANVSETFKKYSEDMLDEKNITVKFSDIDGERRGIGTIRRSPQNITFAPVNEHLLSDADELWPADLPKISEKASAIVSKSITSLGFLDEKEEKLLLSDGDSKKMIKSVTEKPVPNKTISAAKDILKKIEVEEEEIQQSNLGDADTGQQFGIKMKRVTDDREVISDGSVMREGGIIGEGGLMGKGGTMGRGGKMGKRGLKGNDEVMAEEKVDYKVDAKTAPSWVLTGHCDKGCGDSEDSTQEDRSKDKYEFYQRRLRIWATNLEIMCDNLQIWHDWIEITCKNIRHIKRKSERYRSSKTCICRQKDIDCWIKLKRYINKDSEFWLKFKHREKKRLNTYKCIYRQEAKHKPTTTDVEKCICNCCRNKLKS